MIVEKTQFKFFHLKKLSDIFINHLKFDLIFQKVRLIYLIYKIEDANTLLY